MTRDILKVVGIIAAVLILCWGAWSLVVMGVQNTALNYETNAITQKRNVTVEEKRRKDLLPKMVQVVEHEGQFEKDLLVQVTEMRTQMDQGNYGQVSMMLKAVAEAYPTIQTNQDYQNLNKELAVTENRLADNRKAYNETVGDHYKFTHSHPAYEILMGAGYEIKDLQPLEYSEEETQLDENLFSK